MEKDNLTAKEIFDEIREMSKETADIEEALKIEYRLPYRREIDNYNGNLPL